MPLIDTPFKRVAVDIVGPIAPPSEAGHRYILTLVDYATRYPEAVPLKKITTEAVAEALLDIYSRVGIPEEVLTDQGTQFMSECMQEVSRLLSIKGLTSTPYHPICNGLVERWNGTLKSMLKRLCQDQPKQWHRLINPVLFALLGPLCYKLITIVNCYLEASLTCFVYCPKALYLIIFIVWHPF